MDVRRYFARQILTRFAEQKPAGSHGLAQEVRVAPGKRALFLSALLTLKTRGPLIRIHLSLAVGLSATVVLHVVQMIVDAPRSRGLSRDYDLGIAARHCFKPGSKRFPAPEYYCGEPECQQNQGKGTEEPIV